MPEVRRGGPKGGKEKSRAACRGAATAPQSPASRFVLCLPLLHSSAAPSVNRARQKEKPQLRGWRYLWRGGRGRAWHTDARTHTHIHPHERSAAYRILFPFSLSLRLIMWRGAANRERREGGGSSVGRRDAAVAGADRQPERPAPLQRKEKEQVEGGREPTGVHAGREIHGRANTKQAHAGPPPLPGGVRADVKCRRGPWRRRR